MESQIEKNFSVQGTWCKPPAKVDYIRFCVFHNYLINVIILDNLLKYKKKIYFSKKMNQCDRIRLILKENNLKQKELACEIGVTESYISKLLKDPSINISQPLLSLIEEKFGYNSEWIISGGLPKLKQVHKTNTLPSNIQEIVISKIEQMDDEHTEAVLAFINSLAEVKKLIYKKDDAMSR